MGPINFELRSPDPVGVDFNVTVRSGGGSGGTTDHRDLINRDADDQHPIKAITGLQDKLNTIPPAAERITNSEIEEMLK